MFWTPRPGSAAESPAGRPGRARGRRCGTRGVPTNRRRWPQRPGRQEGRGAAPPRRSGGPGRRPCCAHAPTRGQPRAHEPAPPRRQPGQRRGRRRGRSPDPHVGVGVPVQSGPQLWRAGEGDRQAAVTGGRQQQQTRLRAEEVGPQAAASGALQQRCRHASDGGPQAAGAGGLPSAGVTPQAKSRPPQPPPPRQGQCWRPGQGRLQCPGRRQQQEWRGRPGRWQQEVPGRRPGQGLGRRPGQGRLQRPG
jgi:hypothetical protein